VFLILNLLCVALFYLMLEAHTLGALQVIVYAGAIMVLFVFVIMLLNLKAEEGLQMGRGLQRWGAVVFGSAFAAMLFWVLRHRQGRPFIERPASSRDSGRRRTSARSCSASTSRDRGGVDPAHRRDGRAVLLAKKRLD